MKFVSSFFLGVYIILFALTIWDTQNLLLTQNWGMTIWGVFTGGIGFYFLVGALFDVIKYHKED